MPNSYSWTQQQQIFGHTPPAQDFDFSAALPHHSNDIQHSPEQQSMFTFPAQNSQPMSSDSGHSSIHPSFPPNRSQNQRQTTQFTAPMQTNAFNSTTFGSTSQSFARFSSPQAGWNVPPSVSSYRQPNNSTFSAMAEQPYIHPNTSTTQTFHPHVHPTMVSQASFNGTPNVTTDPRGKRPLNVVHDDTGDDDQDPDASDAKDSPKTKTCVHVLRVTRS